MLSDLKSLVGMVEMNKKIRFEGKGWVDSAETILHKGSGMALMVMPRRT